MKPNLDPEVLENLDHLETDLLDYETGLVRGRDETARVQFIFRYAHNLKSSLGMLGFKDASDLLHRVESCFDLVRNAKRKATADLAKASLAALDLVRALLESDGSSEAPDPSAVLGVLQTFLDSDSAGDTAVDLPFRLSRDQAEAAVREVAGGRALWLVDKLVTTNIDEDFFSILPCFAQAAEFGTLVGFRPAWADLPKDRSECVLQLLVAGPADPAAAAKVFRDSFRVIRPPQPARILDPDTLDPDTEAFLRARGFVPPAAWPPAAPSLVVVGPTCRRTLVPSRRDGVAVVAAATFATPAETLALLLDGGPETLAADAVAVGEHELAAELQRLETFFYTGWGGTP